MGRQKKTQVLIGTLPLILWYFAVFFFCCWTAYKAVGSVRNVIEKQRKNKSNVSIGSPKKNNNTRKDPVRSHFLLWVTVACQLCFQISILISGIVYVILFIVLLQTKPKNIDLSKSPAQWVVIMTNTPVPFALLGYDLLLVILLLRMRLTFLKTVYRMSENEVKIGQLIITLVILLQIIGFIILISVPKGFSSISFQIVISLACIIYLSFAVRCVFQFSSKTKCIVEQMQTAQVSHSDDQLVNPAVRLFIVTSLPILMGVVLAVLYVVAVLAQSILYFYILAFVSTFDIGLNSFFLLCTFKSSEPYYEYVFGRLHHWVIRKI